MVLEGQFVKPIINIFLWAGVLHLVSEVSGAWAQSDVANPEVKAEFKTVEWVDLIPPEVLEILLNPPSYIAEIEALKNTANVVGAKLVTLLGRHQIQPLIEHRHLPAIACQQPT